MPRKKGSQRAALEGVIHKINRDFVRMRRADTIYHNAVLRSVLQKLLTIMKKKDEIFRYMSPKLEFMGSYFDGLRVGLPTEYDINLVFKLPIDYSKIKLNSEHCADAYTYVYMPNEFRNLTKIHSQYFQKTLSWCDDKYRLSADKIRSWVQSVLNKAFNELEKNYGGWFLKIKKNIYEINYSDSGPACTLTLKGDKLRGGKIDIDLVPTFYFDLDKTPNNTTVNFRSVRKVSGTKISWYYMVPKPTDDAYSWRLTFPTQEKLFLRGKKHMKPILKLLKLLRDAQSFTGLSSYYIKTIFLWEIDKKSDDFWSNNLTFLLLHMLQRLQFYLNEKVILNFWCPQQNLLEKINSETLFNWNSKLTKIINSVEQNKATNPDVLYKYFDPRESSESK